MSVGGTDTPVHVDVAGNADGKRPCLGNGQTVLMRTPSQDEFVECWSEVIIRNGLRTWIRTSRRDGVGSKEVTVKSIIFLGTHTDAIVTDNIGCTVSF
jgi:hypothetical protein